MNYDRPSSWEDYEFHMACYKARFEIPLLDNIQLIDEYFKAEDNGDRIGAAISKMCMKEMKARRFNFTWFDEHTRLEREMNKVLQKAKFGEAKYSEADGYVFADKALGAEFHKLEELSKEAISNWKIAVMEDSMSEGD